LPTVETTDNRHARRALAAGGERLAYPINDFAEAVGISRRKAYAEIKAGNLRAKKLGSRTIITAPDADAYLEALPDMAA
jgi:hypothetical protein